MKWRVGEFEITRLITGGRWEENCYFVTHVPSGEEVLIDPGSDLPAIESRLAARGNRVCQILLTHAHFDHVGAAAPVCRSTGLNCRLHVADSRLLHHAPMYAELFAHERIEMPVTCSFFADGTEFAIARCPIGVIHSPGHTAGSVCYVFPGFAFTGDTLMHGSIGRTDLPGGNPLELGRSVTNLVESLPADVILFPGHGPAWVGREAREWWSGRQGAVA